MTCQETYPVDKHSWKSLEPEIKKLSDGAILTFYSEKCLVCKEVFLRLLTLETSKEFTDKKGRIVLPGEYLVFAIRDGDYIIPTPKFKGEENNRKKQK